jgi:hypothetical protein
MSLGIPLRSAQERCLLSPTVLVEQSLIDLGTDEDVATVSIRNRQSEGATCKPFRRLTLVQELVFP